MVVGGENIPLFRRASIIWFEVFLHMCSDGILLPFCHGDTSSDLLLPGVSQRNMV